MKKLLKKAVAFSAFMILSVVAFANIELVMWHGLENPNAVKALQDGIASFEKQNPGIKVNAQSYGAADQVNARIMTAIAGNNAPDIFWYGNMAAGQFARTGKLVNIDEMLKKTGMDDSDVYKGLWDCTLYNGERYAVPFAANNLAIYYNKKHFKEAGIKPEDIKTWDDLLEASKKLTNSDRFGFQVPMGSGEWTVWTWMTFLWGANGEFMTVPKYDNVVFDSEAGISALQFWHDLVHKHKVANFSEPGAGYKIDQFVAGNISMMINGPWNYAQLEEAKKTAGLEYGALFIPKAGKHAAFGDGRIATNIGGEDLYLFKSNAEKELAAFKFAMFATTAEFQVPFSIATGYIPVSKSANESPEWKAVENSSPDFLAVYAKNMQYGKARPSVPEYPRISASLGRELERALYGRVNATTALRRAAKDAQRQLGRRK